MRAVEVTSRERKDVAKQLSAWGEDNEDDISDVTDKLGVLIYEIGELEDQYIDKYDQYRITLKSIRDIEGSVQPSRDRKTKITDEIAHLKYKDPQSPKIPVLEQELVRAEAESLVAEAQLSNITREQLKAASTINLMLPENWLKNTLLIAGYGKALWNYWMILLSLLVKLDQLMMVMKLLNKSSLMLKMLWLDFDSAAVKPLFFTSRI